MMITALLVVLGLIMLTSAILALHHPQLVVSVIFAGVVSLTASVVYVMLSAPDVAMTEAAIGSALTTVVFLYALSRIRRAGGNTDGR